MIRIKVETIKNWNIIKDNHKQYFLSIVKNEIKKQIPKDKQCKKYIIFKELFFGDSDEIDDEKIFGIAVGTKKTLDELIDKYNSIIFLNENDKIKYKLMNRFINTRFRKPDKIIKELKELIDNLEKKEKQDAKIFIEDIEKKYTKDITDKGKRREIVLQSQFGNTYKEILDIKMVLEKIFDYENCFGKKGIEIDEKIRWNRHELLSMMGIAVCPYCNRQYINYYFNNIDKSKKTTADLDHFYPKSKYPFLALSLYNFIPSCQICNSRFKGDYDENKPIIYPYEEEFGDFAKFSTNFYMDEANGEKNYDVRYLLGMSDNFKINLNTYEDKIENHFLLKKIEEHKDINIDEEVKEYIDKIKNSKNLFRLKELYNFHKDYVRELIKKAIIYNESRIDELYTQYPELFSSREEVLQMVVSNYICDEDLGKRPLSKLTKDICDELGLR